MDNIKQYLMERVENLEKEKIMLNAAIAQNKTEVQATEDKVREIQEKIDDAYQIFSPKPRNRDMDRTEIAVLGEKKTELQILQSANEKKLAAVEQEQIQVRAYIEQLENGEFIARTSRDTKSVEHLYNRMKQDQHAFFRYVIEKIEPYENKKNEKSFAEIRQYQIGPKNKYNHIISFAANLDLLVDKLNKKYNNRVGLLFDKKESEMSDFQKETMLEFFTEFLEALLSEEETLKIVIKVTLEIAVVVAAFNLSTSKEVDLEQILQRKVADESSGLTVFDLLCVNDGIYRNIVSRGQRQIIIRTKI